MYKEVELNARLYVPKNLIEQGNLTAVTANGRFMTYLYPDLCSAIHGEMDGNGHLKNGQFAQVLSMSFYPHFILILSRFFRNSLFQILSRFYLNC